MSRADWRQKRDELAKTYTNVSAFTGRLRVKATGELLMCEECGKDPATWQHIRKKDGKPVYLCFGCGNH